MITNAYDKRIRLLNQYLTKYCKQIGIVDVEIPELILDAVEFERKMHELIKKRGIEIEHDVLDIGYFSNIYGHCGRRYGRYIFINLEKINSDSDHDSSTRRLLIHELIHYRFPHLKHGEEFFNTLELIFIGKEYPRHHISCPNVPFA